MPHTFSRQELFDLVWSEPTRTIAKRLGISDVGLAKACRRAVPGPSASGGTGPSLPRASR
jgi:hypothetical protein